MAAATTSAAAEHDAHVHGLLCGQKGATGVVVGRPDAPEPIRARLVIGADGRRSVVARTLGLLREARHPRRFAVRGYWTGMEGLGPFGEMHVGHGGYCGVAPLP